MIPTGRINWKRMAQEEQKENARLRAEIERLKQERACWPVLTPMTSDWCGHCAARVCSSTTSLRSLRFTPALSSG
jgi:hypothetical protein